MRPKVYLDTSVINGLFAYEAPWRIETTELLFDKISLGKYEPFVSELVLTEIEQTRNIIKREQLLGVIEEYNLKRLENTPEIDRLTRKYLKEGIIPNYS